MTTRESVAPVFDHVARHLTTAVAADAPLPVDVLHVLVHLLHTDATPVTPGGYVDRLVAAAARDVRWPKVDVNVVLSAHRQVSVADLGLPVGDEPPVPAPCAHLRPLRTAAAQALVAAAARLRRCPVDVETPETVAAGSAAQVLFETGVECRRVDRVAAPSAVAELLWALHETRVRYLRACFRDVALGLAAYAAAPRTCNATRAWLTAYAAELDDAAWRNG